MLPKAKTGYKLLAILSIYLVIVWCCRQLDVRYLVKIVVKIKCNISLYVALQTNIKDTPK